MKGSECKKEERIKCLGGRLFKSDYIISLRSAEPEAQSSNALPCLPTWIYLAPSQAIEHKLPVWMCWIIHRSEKMVNGLKVVLTWVGHYLRLKFQPSGSRIQSNEWGTLLVKKHTNHETEITQCLWKHLTERMTTLKWIIIWSMLQMWVTCFTGTVSISREDCNSHIFNTCLLQHVL